MITVISKLLRQKNYHSIQLFISGKIISALPAASETYSFFPAHLPQESSSPLPLLSPFTYLQEFLPLTKQAHFSILVCKRPHLLLSSVF